MKQFDNLQIVDVKSGKISPPKTIQVENENIVAIADGGSSSVSRELWAIPGLIDVHVHLFENHEDPPISGHGAYQGTSYEEDSRRAHANIHEALKAGITCVRDMTAYGAYNNILRDEIERQAGSRRFRIQSCGRHITRRMNGAHWLDRGTIWNGDNSTLASTIKGEIDGGADFIKLMNDDRIYTLKELQEVVQISNSSGVYVACHAFRPDTIRDAVLAGVRTVEHAGSCDVDLLDKAVECPTFFCPTYVAARDSVACENDQAQKTILESNFGDCNESEFRSWLERLNSQLESAFASGSKIRVIAGTDAGTYPTNFRSLHRELGFYREYGASNLQALQTATINAAEAMELSDKIGTIEVGKSADFVILSSNPIHDIESALENIQTVVSRGQIVFGSNDNRSA